jgi:penicillin V acylase-like amidase (Ntn superfamily)
MAFFLNHRGVEKTAAQKPPEIPFQWKSKYGSNTFHAVGADFPVCGIDESALVVEQTALWNTVYPNRDKRPAIKESRWTQLMPEPCDTVQDVMEQQDEVPIAQEPSNRLSAGSLGDCLR